MELSLYCAVIELLQHAAFQLMRQLSEGFSHTQLALSGVLSQNAPPTQGILPPLTPKHRHCVIPPPAVLASLGRDDRVFWGEIE